MSITCVLGVHLDTIKLFVSLPSAKLQGLQTTVAEFLNKKRATKRQLQHLARCLNRACKVFGRRTFLRRVLDHMNSLSRLSYRLSLEFYADLQWWQDFLSVFNG